MVLRPSDAPRTVPDHIRDARARTSDLQRQQGRGASALRNRTHTLYLDPASAVPVLTPTRVDSGVAFRDGALEVVSGDGTAYADMALRGVDARGPIQASGSIRTASEIIAESGIRSEYGISTSGAIVADADSTFKRRVYADNLSVTGNSIWSFDRDNALRWSTDTAFESCNRSGTEFRGVRCSRVAEVGATSWSWSKTDHRALDEALGAPVGDVIDRIAAGVTGWRHDPDVVPDVATGQQRVGLMLDDLPDVLIERNMVPERVEVPETVEIAELVVVPEVDERGRQTGEVRVEATGHTRYEPTGLMTSEETGRMLDRSSWDLRGVVSALLVEVASLRARLAAVEPSAP